MQNMKENADHCLLVGADLQALFSHSTTSSHLLGSKSPDDVEKNMPVNPNNVSLLHFTSLESP